MNKYKIRKWENNFRLRNESEKEYITRIKPILQVK
jgi:hypothetical protein